MNAQQQAMLKAGVQCARDGLHLVTARRVAGVMGLHHSNVAYYFKTNDALLSAVAGEALRIGDDLVASRLILDNHLAVIDWSYEDRRDCLLRLLQRSI